MVATVVLNTCYLDPMTASAPVLAAGYRRISDDREGKERGVTRQTDDIYELAAANGVAPESVVMFTDNDKGASRFSKKKRDDYAAMLARVAAGEFTYIFSYSTSRLTRRPKEFEHLLDLHDETGVQIVTKGGKDDLSTAQGRAMARIKADLDALEAETIAERVRDAALADARSGHRGGGTRTFGWNEDRITLHPVESAFVREAVARVIAGASLYSVVQYLNQSGLPSVRGGQHSQQGIRKLLSNPRLVGTRYWKGQGIRDREGNLVMGEWEPLLDQTTWDRLQMALQTNGHARAARTVREGNRRYLLSGLIRCGVCSSPLYGNPTRHGGHNYTCRGGQRGGAHSLSISGQEVDALLVKLLLARMEHSILPDVELTFEGQGRLDEIAQEIAAVMAKMKAKSLSAARAFAFVEELESEEAALNEERTEWLKQTTGPSVKRVDLTEWEAMSLDDQRALLREWLQFAVAFPAEASRRTGRRFDPERVDVAWQE